MFYVYATHPPSIGEAMTRKCTIAKACQLMTCYSCRRTQIDETATRLLDAGVDQTSVDKYRYSSINALAWEIPSKPQAPKAAKRKAHKAFTPKVGIDYQGIADTLTVCGSRQYAAHLLMGRTVAELDHIWTLARRTDKIPSKLRKDDRVSHMIESLVGYRLDHNAIMTGAQS